MTAGTLLRGVQAHDAAGLQIRGTYVAPNVQESKSSVIRFTGSQTYTITPDVGYDAMASLSLTIQEVVGPAPVTSATGQQASVTVAGRETKTITLTTVTFTPVLVELIMKGSGSTGSTNLICIRRLPQGTSLSVQNRYYTGVSPTIVVSGKTIQVKLYNNGNGVVDSGAITWQAAGYN